MGIIVRLNQQRTHCPPKSDFTTPKNHYIAFCAIEKTIPLCMQEWWLDTVCTDGMWDVCLSYDEQERIKGAMVYYETTHRGVFTSIRMPQLTPHAGIWMRDMDDFMPKNHQIVAYKQSILNDLIAQLPRPIYYRQKFHHSLTDCLPFYQQGFKGETHYSCVLEDIQDTESVYDNMSDVARLTIRKAEKDLIHGVCDEFDMFYEMSEQMYLKQYVQPNFTSETFKTLDKQLAVKGLRKMYVALDTEGVPHAAIYIIYDNTSAHFLFGVKANEKQGSSALTLLLWQAIQDASNAGLQLFDFEGHMHMDMDSIFQNLNAIQKPFFKISKVRNRIYELFL